MPLPEPTISDLRYQQILDEALARAPVHNPEWTNFNDSDPGVTLLQLFAFMTESLLYRANLLPERNRRKFLRLLGVPVQPATAAQGLVRFSNPRGPLEVRTLLENLELFGGQVPFRTRDGLDVLPIEALVYYKGKPSLSEKQESEAQTLYRQLYASYQAPDVDLELYETKRLPEPVSGAPLAVIDLNEDTRDGCLWVALLARRPKELDAARDVVAGKVLSLGVVPALREATRVLLPQGQGTDEPTASLVYEIPRRVVGVPGAAPEVRYVPLEARPSSNPLVEPSVVELVLPGEEVLREWGQIFERLDPLEAGTGILPPALEDAAVEDRLVTWLRLRPGNENDSSRLSARFSYVCLNAARTTQRARVFAEMLGRGTSEPDQAVVLANVPVIPDSLQLTVDGALWTPINDLAAAAPEVPRRDPATTPTGSSPPDTRPATVYTLDRDTGLIRFGDGLRGVRPPRNALIQASYDYGGGLRGLVGIGALKKGPLLPAGIQVTNPLPTWGADEAETVDEAVRRIPGFLQHRDRLVAAADFKEVTRRTPGVDVGRVEVLPLVHPDIPDFPAEGVVTVLVVPLYDPLHPDTPEPDRLFLNTVADYLDPRRLVTTEVHVRGPVYVSLMVSVGIDAVAGRDLAPMREAVKASLRRFLSPLDGGFDEQGWPLAHDVEALELLAVAARVDGVARVNGVILSNVQGGASERVPISGLELPRLAVLSVQIGEPLSLADLRGELSGTDAPARRVVPIPLVPTQC